MKGRAQFIQKYGSAIWSMGKSTYTVCVEGDSASWQGLFGRIRWHWGLVFQFFDSASQSLCFDCGYQSKMNWTWLWKQWGAVGFSVLGLLRFCPCEDACAAFPAFCCACVCASCFVQITPGRQSQYLMFYFPQSQVGPEIRQTLTEFSLIGLVPLLVLENGY